MEKQIELKCCNCGSRLVQSNSDTFVCVSCGLARKIPTQRLVIEITEAETLIEYDRFNEAEIKFRDIIERNKTLSDAYFGLLRARYGIKVNKNKQGSDVYTCHKSNLRKLREDKDYQILLQVSETPEIRKKYEEMANAIDQVKEKVDNLYKKEKPYDVFISYKDSEINPENGQVVRTQDCQDAMEIYSLLTSHGFRVFFSRISLQAHLGENYEPYIYHALSTAKVFILYSSKEEYLNTNWIKNEYRRYLNLIREGKKSNDSFLFCYKNVDINRLSPEIRSRQGIDFRNFNSSSLLLSTVTKLVKQTKSDVEESDVEIVKDKVYIDALAKLNSGNYIYAQEVFKQLALRYPNNSEPKYYGFLATVRCAKFENFDFNTNIEELYNIVLNLNINEVLEIQKYAYNYLEKNIKYISNSNLIYIVKILISKKTEYRQKTIDLIVESIKKTKNYRLLDIITSNLSHSESDLKASLLYVRGSEAVNNKDYNLAKRILSECELIAPSNVYTLYLDLYIKCKSTNIEAVGEAIARNNYGITIERIVNATDNASKEQVINRFIKTLSYNYNKPRLVKSTIDIIVSLADALDNQAKTVDVLNTCAKNLLLNDQVERAEEVYKRSISILEDNYYAYMGLCLIDYNVKSIEELGKLKVGFKNNPNYKKAMEYATISNKDKLTKQAESSEDNLSKSIRRKVEKINNFSSILIKFYIPLIFILISIFVKNSFVYYILPILITLLVVTVIVDSLIKSITIQRISKSLYFSIPITFNILTFIALINSNYSLIDIDFESLIEGDVVLNFFQKMLEILELCFSDMLSTYVFGMFIVTIIGNIIRIIAKSAYNEKGSFTIVFNSIFQTIVYAVVIILSYCLIAYVENVIQIHNVGFALFLAISFMFASFTLKSLSYNISLIRERVLYKLSKKGK